ncbi:MAG: DUF1826 domain-containing protein [Myxococcota bacterium]
MGPLQQRTSSAQPTRARPFADLLEFGVSTLVRERTLPPELAASLADVADGPTFNHSATVDATAPELDELLEPVRSPEARRLLRRDLAALTREYGALLDRRHVHAQLSVVAHDACRKFHADQVTVRLLCTFAGPGTQWIHNDDVVRENLARIDVDLEEANRSVMRCANAVQQCNPGDVILLKGESFPNNRGAGAVHRSPPVVEDSLRRLVFKIDESPCGC